MEEILQNIILQKQKLLNLINNLINSQLVNQEIFINKEIKKESDLLNFLLIEKQKLFMNQMEMNNNIDPFFMFQPNLMMNLPPQMNINPNHMPTEQMQNKNINNKIDQNKIINVKFEQKSTGKTYVIYCNKNDRISDIIELYKKKSNDYNDNHFIFNNTRLNDLTCAINEIKIIDRSTIIVLRMNILKGGKYCIFIYSL